MTFRKAPAIAALDSSKADLQIPTRTQVRRAGLNLQCEADGGPIICLPEQRPCHRAVDPIRADQNAPGQAGAVGQLQADRVRLQTGDALTCKIHSPGSQGEITQRGIERPPHGGEHGRHILHPAK